METNTENTEKKYWGKKFYESRFNTVLLLVLIVLMIIAIKMMSGDKPVEMSYLQQDPMPNQFALNETMNKANVSTGDSAKEYKNDELGFSFVSPYGDIQPHYNCTLSDGQKECPLISKGNKGLAFLAYLLNSTISFAGATPDFSNESEYDCGALSSIEKYQNMVSLYGEKINAKGIKYVYVDYPYQDGASDGAHQVAYFQLKKSQFPVLGFCAFDTSKEDFMKIIDTVKIY